MKTYYELHEHECTNEKFLSRAKKLKWLRITQERMDYAKELIKPIAKEARKMLKKGTSKDEVANFILDQMNGVDSVEKTLLLYEINNSK